MVLPLETGYDIGTLNPSREAATDAGVHRGAAGLDPIVLDDRASMQGPALAHGRVSGFQCRSRSLTPLFSRQTRPSASGGHTVATSALPRIRFLITSFSQLARLRG